MITGITTHDIILSECIAQRIDYEEMYKIIKELLIKFNDGKAFAGRKGTAWLNNESKKVPYRSRFLDMIATPWKYSKKERKTYAWLVACEKWFEEKSNLVLCQMEEFCENGNVLAHIVESVYLKGKNRKKSDDAMMLETGIKHTRYFQTKKDAIVLYGLLIWKYCKRRDREDKEKGIIDENGNLI